MEYKNIIDSFALNNINCLIAENAEEVKQYLDEMIKDQDSVGCGGSMTLQELKVIDYIRERDINFIDRENCDNIDKCFRDVFSCDVYLSSANAIIEDGTIYNVDGNGNRVSATIFGPKKVIIIVGENKIVKNYAQAKKRVMCVAAPMNAKRLNKNTPCVKSGVCMNCHENDCICCSEVLLRYQRVKNRMNVIIVKGSYGY